MYGAAEYRCPCQCEIIRDVFWSQFITFYYWKHPGQHLWFRSALFCLVFFPFLDTSLLLLLHLTCVMCQVLLQLGNEERHLHLIVYLINSDFYFFPNPYWKASSCFYLRLYSELWQMEKKTCNKISPVESVTGWVEAFKFRPSLAGRILPSFFFPLVVSVCQLPLNYGIINFSFYLHQFVVCELFLVNPRK